MYLTEGLLIAGFVFLIGTRICTNQYFIITITAIIFFLITIIIMIKWGTTIKYGKKIGKNMNNIPFQSIDWSRIPKTEHNGETGVAYWQTVEFPGLRLRLVEYSANYKADHWCEKGHFVYCLEGSVVNELKDGKETLLKPGMSYIVSDQLSSHRSITKKGVKLLIVDGDFLKFNNQ